MAVNLFEVMGKVYVDSKKADETLEQTDSKAKKLGKGFKNTSKSMAKAGGIIGAAVGAVGAGMTALANKTSEYADMVDKTSMKMGVGRKELQEWHYVAGQVGVSQEQMNKGLERLNQRMGRAQQGNEKYTDALKDLGFSQKEIQEGTVSTDEAMMRSIETLNGMESSAKQSALASELFGTKMSRDLMPAIQAGTLSIEDLRKEANDTGAVMSGDAIDASVKYADTVDKLKNTFGGLTRQIGSKVMPIVQKFLDWILNHMPQIQKTFEVVFNIIGTTVGTFIKIIKAVIGWLQDMFGSNEKTLDGMMAKVKEILPKVKEFYERNFKAVWEVLKTVWAFIKDNVLPIYQDMFNWIKSYMPQIREIATTVMNKVVEVLKGVWAFIQDNLLPILASFYGTVREHLPQIQRIIEKVFGIAYKVIKTVWDILDASLIPVIKFLWNNVVSPLLPKIGKMIEKVFGGALEVIENVIGKFESVIGVIGKAVDKLTGWNDTDAEDKTVKVQEERSTSLSPKRYPHHATGTNFAPGGLSVVGERGPELVNLPRGSQVKTNQQTQEMLGGPTYNFDRIFEGAKIEVREESDIKVIAEEIGNLVMNKSRAMGVK